MKPKSNSLPPQGDAGRSRKIIIAVLGFCLLMIALLRIFGGGEALRLLRLQEGAVLAVIAADGSEHQLSAEQIKALPATEFAAVIRASGRAPEEAVYVGVAFGDLLAAVGLSQADIADCARMTVTAADGYIASFRSVELLQADNLFLAYMQDGAAMKTREQGGYGPYQLIARQDSFSQRWAKYVVEIKFEAK